MFNFENEQLELIHMRAAALGFGFTEFFKLIDGVVYTKAVGIGADGVIQLVAQWAEDADYDEIEDQLEAQRLIMGRAIAQGAFQSLKAMMGEKLVSTPM